MFSLGFGFPIPSEVPVGVVLPFIGIEEDVPDGWVLCDGSTFDVGKYPKLCNLLSRALATYTTTVPDLRGRVPVGKDNMGGTSANVVTNSWADSLAGTGGTETHALTAAETPNNIIATNSVLGVAGGDTQAGHTGSGAAHPNIQPSITMNYIIKAA